MNPCSTTRALADSVGVNTHLSYLDTTYGNTSLVCEYIKSLGVKYIRDGCHGWPNLDAFSCYCQPFVELAKLGVKFNCVIDPSENLGAITGVLLYQFYIAYASQIESFEGWNEPDANTPVGWPGNAKAWQQSLYIAAQSLPQQVRSLPVLACALALAANNASSLGSIASWSNFGNLHPYPAGKAPEPVLQDQLQYANLMTGSLPIQVTETGYFTGPPNEYSAQPQVSELAAAKYSLRIILDNWANGIVRTYFYELLEQNSRDYWGLVRSTGEVKQAFKAISNLMALLSCGTDSTLKTLNISVGGVRSLLLQHTNTSWLLCFWNPATAYDLAAKQDIVNAPVALTLGLPSQMMWSVYEPLIQKEMVSAGYGSTLTVQVPDHPVLIWLS